MKTDDNNVSRRRFLEVAVVTAAATKSALSEPAPVKTELQRLEEIVERYGSELGDLRKVR